MLDNTFLLNRIIALEARLSELEELFKPFAEDENKTGDEE